MAAEAQPLTDAEAHLVDVTARSLDRTQDIERALTIGMQSLRNFRPENLAAVVQIVDTQASILEALHGAEWTELAEWAAMVDTWHYPDPCVCGRFRHVGEN